MPSRLRKKNISKDLKLKYLINRRYCLDNKLIKTFYDKDDLNDLIYEINKIKKLNKFSFLNLEIGCGVGDYLNNLAEIKNNEFFIGLDYDIQVIFRAINNIKDKKVDNIKFIVLDANFLLEEPILYKQFDKIIIPFPDPWPKKRHKKRRFVKFENLFKLTNLLKEGGELYIITDNQDYALNINNDIYTLIEKKILNVLPLLNNKFFTTEKKQFEAFFPFFETRYYKKAILKNSKIYYFILKKMI